MDGRFSVGSPAILGSERGRPFLTIESAKDGDMTSAGNAERTILVWVGVYLPGYKAGGPIKALVHMVEQLGEQFTFKITTRDRDLGDSRPFENVARGEWQQVGNARVRYLQPAELRPVGWRRLLRNVDCDLLYLNSFFDRQTVFTLVLRRLGLVPRRPVLLAPRGEFSAGALSLKRVKKRAYLSLARRGGLLRGITLQASSEHEARDIAGSLTSMRRDMPRVVVAADLPGVSVPEQGGWSRPVKVPGEARLAFVGRIARMKNLDFALGLLEGIEGRVRFDVYGPIEDRSYFRECQRVQEGLTPNIQVVMRGLARSEVVHKALGESHLLLMPSRGENFSHAILEALTAGCPVLTSDRTPWRDLEASEAGWDIPLNRPEAFREALRRLMAMDQGEFVRWSAGAAGRARAFRTDPAVLDASSRMLLGCLGVGD